MDLFYSLLTMLFLLKYIKTETILCGVKSNDNDLLISKFCQLYKLEVTALEDFSQLNKLNEKYYSAYNILLNEPKNKTNFNSFYEDIIKELKPSHINVQAHPDYSWKILKENDIYFTILNHNQSWRRQMDHGLTIIHDLSPNFKTWIKEVEILNLN